MELSQANDVVLNLTFEAVRPQSQHKRLEYQIKINPKSLQEMRLNTNKQSEQKGGEQVLAGYGVSRVSGGQGPEANNWDTSWVG